MSQKPTAKKPPAESATPTPQRPVEPWPPTQTKAEPVVSAARRALLEEQKSWDAMAQERGLPDYQRPGTFWHVMFSGKVRKFDPERVRLIHQGVGREWARMVPTIAPSCYLEVADHALEQQFQMVPHQPEKQLAPIAKFPFTVLRQKGKNGEATEAEYIALLQQGQKTYIEKLNQVRTQSAAGS